MKDKYLFNLTIIMRDFEWHSPYKDTLARRVQVYDPFQTRNYLPLSQVTAILDNFDFVLPEQL